MIGQSLRRQGSDNLTSGNGVLANGVRISHD